MTPDLYVPRYLPRRSRFSPGIEFVPGDLGRELPRRAERVKNLQQGQPKEVGGKVVDKGKGSETEQTPASGK